MKQTSLILIRRLVQLFFRLFFKFYCPLRQTGVENLPSDQSFILCANQSSHLDVFALIYASRRDVGDFIVMIAEDHLYGSAINQLKRYLLFLLFDYIAVRRYRNRDESWLSFVDALSHQLGNQSPKILLMFPDGTRTRTGELVPFKPGVSFLAHQLELPVIPAYIQGLYESLSCGVFFPKRKQINLLFGEMSLFSKALIERGSPHMQAYKGFAERLFEQVQLMMTGLYGKNN